MKTVKTAAIACLAIPVLFGAGPVLAASLESLQGAWLVSGQDCAATFEKKGGAIRFKDAASSLATGIIIAGDRITGPNGVCSVKRVRDDGGRLSLHMGCADAVLASSMSVSLKIVDADTFELTDPLFPDETQNYQRCKL